MIDTQTPDYFPRTDMTERKPLKPVDEPGPNGVRNNGLLYRNNKP